MSYQFLPPLSDAEYDALRADIAANGMRHPILVDEKGKILDGHHRARIAAELDFKPERTVLAGLTEQEKRDIAFTANTARRHMDQAQRRAAVIESLKADPQLSDRQHGRRTGVSHPTVAGIRAEMVAAGRLESLTSRIGADGRERPATRPSSPTDRDPDLTSGPAVATADPSGQDHPLATGEADARLDRDGALPTAASEATTAPTVEAGADEPARPRPPAWSPEERRQHEEDVRRSQDIDAARRTSQTVVPDFLSACSTIVAGSRYGEPDLVTKDMIVDLRKGIDLLEGEL